MKLMGQSELTHLEDDTPTIQAGKGVVKGFVVGSGVGAVVANLFEATPVERNVKYPGLMRTLKVSGNYGLTLATFGGIYVAVEHLLLRHRMKRDSVNVAVSGFVAGASVLGFRGRSISAGLSSGSIVAATCIMLDYLGETKVDSGNMQKGHTTN